MNKTFSKTLVDDMHRYNSRNAAGAAGGGEEAGARAAGDDLAEAGGADAKIRKVKGEIEEVKQVMTDNIDRILDRGDKIDLLVDKSLDLSAQVVSLPSLLPPTPFPTRRRSSSLHCCLAMEQDSSKQQSSKRQQAPRRVPWQKMASGCEGWAGDAWQRGRRPSSRGRASSCSAACGGKMPSSRLLWGAVF